MCSSKGDDGFLRKPYCPGVRRLVQAPGHRERALFRTRPLARKKPPQARAVASFCAVAPFGSGVWTRIDFDAHPFDRIRLRLSWLAPLGES
jgi:hypothetical protein